MDSEKGLHLVEIADGVSVQDVVEATEAEFTVSCLLGKMKYRISSNYGTGCQDHFLRGCLI